MEMDDCIGFHHIICNKRIRALSNAPLGILSLDDVEKEHYATKETKCHESSLFVQQRKQLAELTAVRDDDGLLGGTALAANLLDSFDDILAFGDLTEDDVLAIQPFGVSSADEELGSIGVRAGVGHGQGAHALVLEDKVLILELLAIDRLAPRTVSVGEVSSL